MHNISYLYLKFRYNILLSILYINKYYKKITIYFSQSIKTRFEIKLIVEY